MKNKKDYFHPKDNNSSLTKNERLIIELIQEYGEITQSFMLKHEKEHNSVKSNFINIILSAMSHVFSIFRYVNHNINIVTDDEEKETSEDFKKSFKDMLHHYLKENKLL